jgi:hypothetical protein
MFNEFVSKNKINPMKYQIFRCNTLYNRIYLQNYRLTALIHELVMKFVFSKNNYVCDLLQPLKLVNIILKEITY